MFPVVQRPALAAIVLIALTLSLPEFGKGFSSLHREQHLVSNPSIKRVSGVEPPTAGLENRRSAIELHPRPLMGRTGFEPV
jgi:hypothetical protein